MPSCSPPPPRPPADLVPAAYHEAGHAIAYWANDLHFRYVTIRGRQNDNIALWRPRRIRPNESTFVASAGPIAELHHTRRHLDDDQLAVILAESSELDLEDEDQAPGDFATFADSASRYLPREEWLPEWRNNERVLTTSTGPRSRP